MKEIENRNKVKIFYAPDFGRINNATMSMPKEKLLISSAIPIKVPMTFFCRNIMYNLKINMKPKDP